MFRLDTSIVEINKTFGKITFNSKNSSQMTLNHQLEHI